jgi:hypothetical protein
VSRLVASYSPPSPIADFVALDGTIDLKSEAASIPAWWEFKNTGACRQSAAGISADVNVLPNAGASCTDTWNGGNTATALFTGYQIGFAGDPNRARAVFAVARPASQPTAIAAGTTYFGWIWSISNAGTATCAGCATPVAVVLNTAILRGVSGASVRVDSGDAGSQPCATWQTAASGTCTATPVHPQTWGSVKSLYR